MTRDLNCGLLGAGYVWFSHDKNYNRDQFLRVLREAGFFPLVGTGSYKGETEDTFGLTIEEFGRMRQDFSHWTDKQESFLFVCNDGECYLKYMDGREPSIYIMGAWTAITPEERKDHDGWTAINDNPLTTFTCIR